MTSSSKPSTRKTNRFRLNVLEPAGLRFIGPRDEPHNNARSLCQDLFQFTHCITQQQSRNLPAGFKVHSDSIGTDSAFSDEVLNALSSRAIEVAQSAAKLEEGGEGGQNEMQWRTRCHTQAVAMIAAGDSGSIKMVVEQEWQSCIAANEVILFTNRPDYTFSLDVKQDTSLRFLDRSSLNRISNQSLNPYVNEDRDSAFPMAIAESKSFLGIKFEAENQCAESALKMLNKLRNLGASASKLPVLCCSLFGSIFTVYVACCDEDPENERCHMQRLWIGEVSDFWTSLQFQMILFRYSSWWLHHAIPIVQSCIEGYQES